MARSLRRLVRHGLSGHRTTRQAFGPEALARLQTAIAAGEASHRGEVRLIIEGAMPLRKVWRGMSSRHRALDLFGTFRVWDTEENNGVLLYLNLADRRVEIIADRAAARLVPQQRWHAICQTLRDALGSGQFEAGTGAAILAIHQELAEAFPADGKGVNQQPDAPVVL